MSQHQADQNYTTIVIDGGARYGMHPTWNSFTGDIQYYAFEPDPKECVNLSTRNKNPGYHVIQKALWLSPGKQEINFFSHKGQSSFFAPDLTSDWFKYIRPDDGNIIEKSIVDCDTLDHFAASNNLLIDFVKLDVEGAEYEVLLGSETQLQDNILGLRCEVNFQADLIGQKLFPDIQLLLAKKDFFLLNLDYFGRGVPRSPFYKNPDPLSPDTDRYGVLASTDAVWLKDYKTIKAKNVHERNIKLLKYASFAFMNNAPDVGLEALSSGFRLQQDTLTADLKESSLYRFIRKAYAQYLGRWRIVPNDNWKQAQQLYQSIFTTELVGGADYFEFIRSL